MSEQCSVVLCMSNVAFVCSYHVKVMEAHCTRLTHFHFRYHLLYCIISKCSNVCF